MTRNHRAFALLFALVAAACGGGDDDTTPDAPVTPDAPPPGERRLILFHTNDEHSHVFGFAPEIDDFPPPATPGDGTIVGGIARRAQKLGELRAAAAADGAETLTVSAGD